MADCALFCFANKKLFCALANSMKLAEPIVYRAFKIANACVAASSLFLRLLQRCSVVADSLLNLRNNLNVYIFKVEPGIRSIQPGGCHIGIGGILIKDRPSYIECDDSINLIKARNWSLSK